MAEAGLDLPAEVVCSHREASPMLCPPETSLEFKQPYRLSALGRGIIDALHRAITTTVMFLARRMHYAVLTVLAAVAVQSPCRILQVMDQSLLSHDSSPTAATRCSIMALGANGMTGMKEQTGRVGVLPSIPTSAASNDYISLPQM